MRDFRFLCPISRQLNVEADFKPEIEEKQVTTNLDKPCSACWLGGMKRTAKEQPCSASRMDARIYLSGFQTLFFCVKTSDY